MRYRLSGISIFTVWNRTECKTHTKSRKASFAWFLDTFLYQFKFSIILPQQIMLPQFSQFSQRSKCYSTILCKRANRITNLLLLTSYISKNQLVFGSSHTKWPSVIQIWPYNLDKPSLTSCLNCMAQRYYPNIETHIYIEPV